MGVVILKLCCAVLLTTTEGVAPAPLTIDKHPWGQYLPNSWCIVQTDTISNVDGRAVHSSQTVRTTLQASDANSITLQELETLNVGGKSVEKQPLSVKYDFFQEPILEDVKISHGPHAKLIIGKSVVPCAVRIYNHRTSGGNLTTTVWYTPHVYPYILRVEKILRTIPDGEGATAQIVRQSVMIVQDTAALKTLRSSRRIRLYNQHTEEKVGNITKITDARCSWDVPGGLLDSTTRELDAQNREIRRSVSRMTNYSLVDPPLLFPSWSIPALPTTPAVPAETVE